MIVFYDIYINDRFKTDENVVNIFHYKYASMVLNISWLLLSFFCVFLLFLLQMVVTFGMSDIGPWSLMDSSAQSGDVIMRMMARNSMSEKLAEDIDAAVKQISDKAYEIALSHIRNNREAMDKIVEVLLEKETMTGDEFRAILSEFVEIPVENRVPPARPAAVPA